MRRGWLLAVQVTELADPITLADIPLPMRTGQAQPMFTHAGEVVQGYLYPVDVDWFAQFARTFADRLPDDLVTGAAWPVELTGGAERLLRGLIGDQLHTLTGNSNKIIEVGDDAAIVVTDRSAIGQPVSVAEVQAALDLLRRDGTVICQPPHVGYEGAFIGAVLRTVPGTAIGLHPPTVSFATGVDTAPPPTPTIGGRAPDGPLDASATRNVRLEQPALRRALVGNRSHARCALCGEDVPVDLLVAAHIKQRSVCSDDEKRDLLNVGMLACKLGCDDLYELGYISVDANGTVTAADPDDTRHGQYVSSLITRLAGSSCRAFTTASAAYFRWHRDTTFRGNG